MTDWVESTLELAQNVRRRAAEVCIANNGGYLVQTIGSAEIFATLFSRLMDLGPSNGPLVPVPFDGVPRPGEPAVEGSVYNGDRDRFFLSPAHYALGLYSTLCEVGRLGEEVLAETNADGSTLEMIGAEHSPGFEATTGSLAQALSVAVGQALVHDGLQQARLGQVHGDFQRHEDGREDSRQPVRPHIGDETPERTHGTTPGCQLRGRR